MTFRSTYDGSLQRLTPELAVRMQERLGADIQMALDICCGLPAPEEDVRLAAKRTLAWAVRARDAHRRPDQCLFGIVQGGVATDLRAEQAAQLAALEFDGYGIGGLSVGEPRQQMLPALAAALGELPADRPRYLMGVGDPVTLLEAVALGVDMFDCVLPTRLARHGTALTSTGRYQVRAARHASDEARSTPPAPAGYAPASAAAISAISWWSASPPAGRLLTIHNLSWLLAWSTGPGMPSGARPWPPSAPRWLPAGNRGRCAKVSRSLPRGGAPSSPCTPPSTILSPPARPRRLVVQEVVRLDLHLLIIIVVVRGGVPVPHPAPTAAARQQQTAARQLVRRRRRSSPPAASTAGWCPSMETPPRSR